LTSTLTLSEAVDLNGGGDGDSTSTWYVDFWCESSPKNHGEGHVEVDDGLNVHGHVQLNDSRQGQGPGQRQPKMRQPKMRQPKMRQPKMRQPKMRQPKMRLRQAQTWFNTSGAIRSRNADEHDQ
jgi:hypothetical protein